MAFDDTDLKNQIEQYASSEYQRGKTEQQPQIDQLKAQVADLQDQLAKAQAGGGKAVIYGANTGGWFSTKGESQASATKRIKAGLGGTLPAIRIWTSNGIPSATASDPTCQRYVCEFGAGQSDAAMDAAFKNTPQNAVLVPVHEVENKLTPADFQAYVKRFGAAHERSGRKDVTVALMLMGTTYHPSRYTVDKGGPNAVGHKWDEWIPQPLPPGVDAIGGDLYPWGADDAHADTPETVVGPARDAAKKMGVPFYVGEFGCGKKTWSDAKRAQFTDACFDMFEADPGLFPVICVYEADNGGAGPWCVLPPPDGTAWSWPLTVEVIKSRFAAVPVPK